MGILGQKQHIRLAIDVSGHAIRGLVFQVLEGGIPKIVRKMKFKSPEEIPAEKIGEKLHEFVFELIKSLERVPEKITIGVGPELGSQEILTWKLEKTEGFRLATVKHLEPYFFNLFEQYGTAHHGAIAYPLEVLANGYSLENFFRSTSSKPISFRDLTKNVHELEFRTLCLHFAESTGASLFEMKRSLGGMPVEFVPRVAAYESAITKGIGIQDVFSISIGWEETSLFLIHGGVLVSLVSFPMGERHCVRSLAENLSISTVEAEDLKRQEGEIGVESGTKVSEVIAPEMEKWKSLFLSSLNSFFIYGPVPPKVFLFGVGSHFPQFSEFLKTAEWMKEISYASSPELISLGAEAFFGGNTFSGALRGQDDLILASLVFYSIHHNSLFD